MAQRWTLEIKVGAFVILGLALLVVFVFAIGDLSKALKPGYPLRITFDSGNGITHGAPVQYAGVEVGSVRNVKLIPSSDGAKPKIQIVIHLPASVRVRSDDEASISTFDLLGEKYLEITPGPGKGTVMTQNGELIGKLPVSTERVIERSNEVLTELKQTLTGGNSFFGGEEARVYLKEAIQEARDGTRNWKVLGERLNLAMSYAESGEGTLGKLLFDEGLYRQMTDFVDDLQAHPWKLLVHPKSKSDPKSTR